MSKFNVAMKRFGGFMKRNAFYFLIVLCIASVAAVIALAVTRDSNSLPNNDISVNNPEKPDEKPDDKDPTNPDDNKEPEKLTFHAPCNGTVSLGHSDTELVWMPNQNGYATHLGLDFKSDDNKVFAAADGVIAQIDYDELNGHYVVINHADGYQTRYLSLENPCTLKVGDAVKQGDSLGMMSASQGDESLHGAHLHFEVYKNNEQINPLDVLILEEK